MFLRFVVGTDSQSPRELTGLFTEVEYLRKEGLLLDYQENMVDNIFGYFNNNLPCPPYSETNWSINAISWFRDSATEFINKMWDLKAILEQNDISVRILKVEKPGMILYEDEFQVVAQDRVH
ncbi:hypothetical protein [Polaribacter sp. BAL334]|uniref:hypothetical protein n=1 Tax=Polaribacter sp. BAL334 TaxID=1708178 RepID=UPI0018D2191E|nr:hypothetical protein [Polaribacter sp. BAL334]